MFAHVQPNGFCEAICDDYKYLRNCVICGKTCEIYLRKPGLKVIKPSMLNFIELGISAAHKS